MKKSYLYLIVVISFLLIVLPYFIVFFKNGISTNINDWGAFGNYLNGLLMPILSFINILVLISVSNSVSKLSMQDKEHKKKLETINKEITNNQFKITINPNASILDNYKDLTDNINAIRMYLKEFHSSDEKCLEDLYDIFNRLNLPVERIDEIPYYNNPFINRNWESHNLGVNNTNSLINYSLLQLKINIYKLLLEKEPDNISLQSKLKSARKELEQFHKGNSFVD